MGIVAILKMNKRILTIFLFFILIINLIGCAKNVSSNDESDKDIINEEADIEEIYKDDKAINLFINQYNKINDSKITSDMISKKHIAGKDRDNVISVKNDKLEINIYDNFSSNDKYNISVYVGYTGQQSTSDDYKEQFLKFIKIFDSALTNEEIDMHWDDLLSDYHSSYEINDIELNVYTNNGKISYFKLTKTIEL